MPPEPPRKQSMGVDIPPLREVARDVQRGHPSFESSNPPPAKRPARPPYEPKETPYNLQIFDPSKLPGGRPPRVEQAPLSEHPKSGSLAIVGKGWRVSLPTAAITGLLAIAGTWITNKATNESATIREIGAAQDRDSKRYDVDRAHDREERAKQDAAIRERLDQLQTRVSVIEGQNVELDKTIDRLVERLERRRAPESP